MKYMEFTGKTVDEAVEKGLNELGLTKDEADIRVLEEGKKKLFGWVKARVEIGVKETETIQENDKAEQEQEPKQCERTCCNEKDQAEEKSVCENKVCQAGKTDGQRTVEFLEGLFDILNITACTELVYEGERVEINVTAANTNPIIGKHGAMLDAIQTLAGAVANTGREDYKRVVVDCENYRENRESTLKKLAENLAQKAVRLGKKIKLEPMNPYERRIIHAALSEREDVSTQSEGKEPNRCIVIIPDNLEDPSAPAIEARNDRRGHDNRGNRGGRGNYGRGNRGGKDSRGGYKKPYNRDRKPSSGSSNSGGTTLKANNDFFGIFLGNSGSGEDNE